MLMEWKALDLDQPCRIAESRAGTKAELIDDLEDFWIEALELDADEITVSTSIDRASFEAAGPRSERLQLFVPFIRSEYGHNPYDPASEPEEYARQDFEMHRELVNLAREAFDRDAVRAVYFKKPRPVFTQHAWDQAETRYPIDVEPW